MASKAEDRSARAAALLGRLRLPVVAAPMFLVSGPDLVVACCRAGVLGTIPALNQRTTEGFAAWLDEVEARLTSRDAPYGVNLIVHASNPRLHADLEVVVAHQVPVVITSLGAARDVVAAVHSYGGLVLHDVTTLRHARAAAEAGVDGLILVSAGAGGHAGTLNPFAFVASVRPWFTGLLLLAGGLSRGADVFAAQAMGADLAYLGTRFLASAEADAAPGYREMLVDAQAADIVYTPAVSSVPANFLRASLAAAGIDPDADPGAVDLSHLTRPDTVTATAWRDVWSAGQGVAAIHDIPFVADLVDRLTVEYEAARDRCAALAADVLAPGGTAAEETL